MTTLSPRRTLSVRAEPPPPPPVLDRAATSDEQVLLDAFATRTAIGALYNRGQVVLEPVLLFEEHDVLFLVAATVTRDGKPPREPKLGVFRVPGLTAIEPTDQPVPKKRPGPIEWDARPQRRVIGLMAGTPAPA